MKNLLILLVLISASFSATGAHHEEGEAKHRDEGNNFAYLSSYTIPAGTNPATLAKSLEKIYSIT
jgi:hypothetical protein